VLSCVVWWVVGASALGASPVDLAALDRLYAQRDEPKVLAQLERQVSDQLSRGADDYALVLRGARAHCAAAKAQSASAQREAEALVCWRLGDRARALSPSSAEAHYWAAIGVGLWAQSVGVFRAITEGIEAKLSERLDMAIVLDPEVDHGGPWLFKGRYFQEAPWPIRDMKRAGEYFDKALARFPDSLRARLYYASWLADQGQQQKARRELEAVLASDSTYDPPDARAAKAEAAKKLSALR